MFLSKLFSKSPTYLSIQDLKLKTTVREHENSAINLRKKVEILLIDDVQTDIVQILSNHGFNIRYKKDIDYVKDVEGYDIVICDIRGVGKSLSDEHEGAYLISEIRKTYPNKILIAYTGSTYDCTYDRFMQCADTTVNKGISSEDFVDILDDKIKESMDVTYQWKRLRKKLLDLDIPIIQVADLEDKLVKSLNEEKFSNFEDIVNNYDDNNSKLVLMEFLQSLCIRLIKEVISHGA